MQSQQRRILAVDDNSVILNVVRFNLENAGFAVTTARNGRAAWDLLQAEDFDLVITDYQMPEMTGEALCQRMREVDRLRNVPVILLSGKGLELDLARLKEELGVDDVLSKPMSPKALVAVVEVCLSERVETI
jgi:two-component system alkaline phosphatase synthesis response regulator PhoP